MTTWPKRDKDGRHITSVDIPICKSATQREWELETRIKKLEGNDLDSLISEFNDNIDIIVNKAVNSLDEYNNIAKMRNQVVEVNRVINGLSRISKIQAEHARRQGNTGMYGSSYLTGLPSEAALNQASSEAAFSQALGVDRLVGW